MNHRQLRTMLCILMVILYVAGLICFFLSALEAGVALWFLSTVGGFLTLRFIHKHDEASAQKDAEDDPPCE